MRTAKTTTRLSRTSSPVPRRTAVSYLPPHLHTSRPGSHVLRPRLRPSAPNRACRNRDGPVRSPVSAEASCAPGAAVAPIAFSHLPNANCSMPAGKDSGSTSLFKELHAAALVRPRPEAGIPAVRQCGAGKLGLLPRARRAPRAMRLRGVSDPRHDLFLLPHHRRAMPEGAHAVRAVSECTLGARDAR